MFGSEKRKKKAEEAERAKQEAQANAEFEAKFTAKQERKKIEKMVSDLDKSCNELLQKAVEAKAKNQGQIYRTYTSALKVARARKAQAENFLAQVDAMQQMQSIANGSKELLNSMNTIMSSMGKLTIDPRAMMESQKNAAALGQSLDMQNQRIDSFFGTLSDMIPDATEDSLSMADVDRDIDSEVNAILRGNASAGTSSSGSTDTSSDLADLKRMLNS